MNFFRGWAEYAGGFGDPQGNYWLGLQHIHTLTRIQQTELYVGLTDFDLGFRYARYGTFLVAAETDKFRLTVDRFSGSAGEIIFFVF